MTDTSETDGGAHARDLAEPKLSRRFCWSCLFLALAPFAALLGVGWLISDQVSAGRALQDARLATILEELADIEVANDALRDDLGSTRDALSAARAAIIASGAETPERLAARVAALPSEERDALLEAAGLTAPPVRDDVERLLDGLEREAQTAFFDGLPDLPAFAEWFARMSDEGRAAWLDLLPNYAPPQPSAGDEVVFGPDPATIYETLRTERDLAQAQRDAFQDERDALKVALQETENERAAALFDRETQRAELEALRDERDEALRQRTAAFAARDAAVADREDALRTREEIGGTRAAALAERDAAVAERADALAARDAARAARDEAFADRDALTSERDRLQLLSEEQERDLTRLQGAIARLEAELANLRAELAATAPQNGPTSDPDVEGADTIR